MINFHCLLILLIAFNINEEEIFLQEQINKEFNPFTFIFINLVTFE